MSPVDAPVRDLPTNQAKKSPARTKGMGDDKRTQELRESLDEIRKGSRPLCPACKNGVLVPDTEGAHCDKCGHYVLDPDRAADKKPCECGFCQTH
jgi:hypothetical protein